jgi:hypothetical protein
VLPDGTVAVPDIRAKSLFANVAVDLEETIGHFLRIRRERELGYDIEMDLNPGLGHVGPRFPEAEPGATADGGA